MAGAQSAWGIDVGVSSLKAIKLRRDGERVNIEAYDVIEHDKFLSESDVDRDALIRSTLQKFMNKYNPKRDVVFIGVPGSTTFARFVKLPPVETKKIPEIVRFEAIQQIPFPLEQVNWDYHTFQSPDSPDVEVGIFAMKKELVAQIMSNFRAVDMNVQGVQMSPLAVYNAAAFDGMTDDKGTVVIDMGAEHTDIVIMDQGRVWLRSIGIGGNHFTDALAKSFKQQFSKAEKLKKEAATSKYQKQIYQAMRPIFADLVAEIQRSLGAYNSSHRDSRLERIVGMGNPFKLPNLQKYLQQELKMDVVRLESFRHATVEKAAAFSENILSMSTAYGLAVQALGMATIDTNLLPTEIARQMMWKKKQPWFVGAAACIAAGSAFMVLQWYAAHSAFASSQNGPAADNTNALGPLTDLRKEWKGVNDNFDLAVKQVEAQTTLVAARRVWPEVMMDVFSSLPPSDARNGPSMVITSMTSDYSNLLSSTSTTPSNQGAQGQPGMATPAPAAAGATPQPAENQVGESDHGFLVFISGYTRVGGHGTVTKFSDVLMSKAPVINAVAATDTAPAAQGGRLFYYEGAKQSGGTIEKVVTGGAGFGGFGAVPNNPGGGSSLLNTKPWGNVKGKYWDFFYTDLTGYRPPPAAVTPGGVVTADNQALDTPYPIDMVGTRLTDPPSPKRMDGVQFWSFTLGFRVHLRNEIK
jgi:type IV pilus assembly protein PilM